MSKGRKFTKNSFDIVAGVDGALVNRSPVTTGNKTHLPRDFTGRNSETVNQELSTCCTGRPWSVEWQDPNIFYVQQPILSS